MRRTARVLLATAALLAGLGALALALLAALGSHRRAAVVLVRTLDLPVGRTLVGVLTPEPELRERTIAGVPTTVALPPGEGPRPALVFVNGVTERGRRHPAVRRLADALARVGLAAYVPDVHGLAAGEITE
ncbi:MAG TPA: hypothetical protein VNJ46_09420, partial [Gaiellaceae bacterium]|nr:hypothetical protein [Gaiellaceae bacterium]